MTTIQYSSSYKNISIKNLLIINTTMVIFFLLRCKYLLIHKKFAGSLLKLDFKPLEF
jgi:hypothetical protein